MTQMIAPALGGRSVDSPLMIPADLHRAGAGLPEMWDPSTYSRHWKFASWLIFEIRTS